MEALKASKLVFSEMLEMMLTILEISWDESAKRFAFFAVSATV